MNITSLSFFVFCAASLLIYRVLPAQFRKGWLFVASVGFVISWSLELACILLLVVTTNFYLGQWLQIEKRRQSTILKIGISFNVVVLFALKYSNYFFQPLARLLNWVGFHGSIDSIKLLATMGLSFITLQMISYLVDASRNQLKAEKRWIEFTLYALYFPKLLSGPIERAKTFISKLDAPDPLDSEKIIRALALILIGLVRKRLFADALTAVIPEDVFVTPLTYSAPMLLLWIIAYAFALYNDFAGYTSIVRGISSLFGIELTNNFNVPYFSQSFSEFWNRWHISLSNWLRDYIYFPVSRALLKKIPKHTQILNIVVPPMLTMLVSGLWHGLSWSLLLWGGLHGTFLVVERLSKLKAPGIPPNEQTWWKRLLGNAIVFTGVIFAWLPFHMGLVTAKRYFAGLILPSHWVMPDWLWIRNVLFGHLPFTEFYQWNLPDPRIILILIPAVLLDWVQFRYKDELVFLRWPRYIKVIFYSAVILGIVLMSFSDTGMPFVYQGF